MNRLVFGVSLALVIGWSPSGALDSFPKAWLACERDADCTAVKLGCYRWQPVSKEHALDMEAAGAQACLASVDAGPRPPSACAARLCELAPTVGFWKALASYPGFQGRLVERRLASCFETAGVVEVSSYFGPVLGLYSRKVDDSIRERRGPDGERLERVLASALPCGDVLAWQEVQRRWAAKQADDPSPIRVRLEPDRLDYPFDDIYPPLIGYKAVLEGCAAAQGGPPSPWGEMTARFTVQPSGRIAPGSFKATFMAAPRMREFVDCLSAPFERLVFPKPKDGRPVSVDALYQVPAR